jgi:hypothetical protein
VSRVRIVDGDHGAGKRIAIVAAVKAWDGARDAHIRGNDLWRRWFKGLEERIAGGESADLDRGSDEIDDIDRAILANGDPWEVAPDFNHLTCNPALSAVPRTNDGSGHTSRVEISPHGIDLVQASGRRVHPVGCDVRLVGEAGTGHPSSRTIHGIGSDLSRGKGLAVIDRAGDTDGATPDRGAAATGSIPDPREVEIPA